MPLTVLVAGGGRIGAALARLLAADDHAVTVVEPRQDRVEELRDQLPQVTVVHGDASDPAVLEAAGARQRDVVAAVTGDDAVNVIVASLARSGFGVPRTIARIVDPASSWLFSKEMGVDVPLDQAQLIAHLVAEEMSLGEMTTLVKLRRGRFALVEERVHAEAGAVGRSVATLGLPEDCVLLAVLRGDEIHPAHGDLRIEAGDEVLALVRNHAADRLHRALGPPASPDQVPPGASTV